MWHELLDELDLDEHSEPDLTACFFVGDAGGRPARSTAKADHSCSDRSKIHSASCVSWRAEY